MLSHGEEQRKLHWGEVQESGFFLKTYVNRLQRKENKCLRRVEDVTLKNNLLLPCLGPSWKSELKEGSSVRSAKHSTPEGRKQRMESHRSTYKLTLARRLWRQHSYYVGHTHTHKCACMLLLHFKTERKRCKSRNK